MSKKLFFTSFSLLVFIDLITKYFVVSKLTQFDTIVIIPHFFNIVLVRNKGIAFGLFSEVNGIFKDVILFLIAILVMYFLIDFLKNVKSKALCVSIAMIVAGVVGNILDRLINGSVIDFIDLYFKKFHWPSFNFADIYITLGIFSVMVILIKDWKKLNA